VSFGIGFALASWLTPWLEGLLSLLHSFADDIVSLLCKKKKPWISRDFTIKYLLFYSSTIAAAIVLEKAKQKEIFLHVYYDMYHHFRGTYNCRELQQQTFVYDVVGDAWLYSEQKFVQIPVTVFLFLGEWVSFWAAQRPPAQTFAVPKW
jgi:hypothetical protein